MAVIIATLASLSSAPATDASTFEASISALKSSISTLESSIHSLAGASGWWENVGWYCAIVVGIGVIAEIFTIAREYRGDAQDWRRGIVRPPDRPSFKWMMFDVFATVIVVAGIFGEAGATGKVSLINSQLRSKTSELRAKSDQLLAVVTLEAGSAAASALKSQGSADAARRLAVQAQEKAQAAEGSAARIGKLAAKLSDDERQLRTNTEEAALILAAKASGREFLPNLFESLKGLPPAKAEVRYNSSGEATTRIFAENLCSSLEGLGWTVSRVPRNSLAAGPTGTIVVNKWESRENLLESARVRAGKLEANILILSPHIEVSNGISSTLARRLVTLGMSLDATLIKAPTTDSNSFLIIIGDVVPNKGK